MSLRNLQNSFLGGELAPSMLGRVDDSSYKTGACELKNFLVLPQGAITKRPGFEFVTQTSEDVRLIPFRFASNQTLVLVFTHKRLMFITNGAVLTSGSTPYVIETPYNGRDLFEIDYCQNADIITLTCSKYPPMELRRYGVTDWRFVEVKNYPDIQPPSYISATAIYPPETDKKDKGLVTAKYVVTAVDKNKKESVSSDPIEIDCNYYLTGGYVTLSWSSVDTAVRYRIYRNVCGIYGFIGETEDTEVIDYGDNPDTTYSPPLYSSPFSKERGGIKSVTVIDGGSGYEDGAGDDGIVPTSITIPYVRPLYAKDDVQGSLAGSGASAQDLLNNNPIILKAYENEREIASFKITTGVVYYNKKCSNFGNDYGQSCNSEAIITATGRSKNGYVFYFTEISGKKYNNLKFKFTYNATKLNKGGSGAIFDEFIENSTQGFDSKYDKLYSDGMSLKEILSLSKDTEKSNVKLAVRDSTGSGAELRPVVENGVIRAVEVVRSGRNYTSPTIDVISTHGSGAGFSVTLIGDENVDYPSACTQYDQRRVFAGTSENPLKVWMTNAGQQDLMMYHIPTKSDDRIEITAVTADADRIKHAVALDSLILFTGSSELRVFTQNSDALTPESIAVRAQSYVGANQVQPVIVNSNVVYCASRGGHLRHLSYIYSSGGYVTDDLSLRATHLFDGFDIEDLTLSKSPIQTLWAVSSNGSLLTATYVPEQKILSWTKHQTNGKFKSVCAVSEGAEDHVYVAVTRVVQGVQKTYIERLGDIVGFNNKHLDSYLEGHFDSPQNEVSNLNHLEGFEVTVINGGKIEKNKIVKNGKVLLDNAGTDIVVGIPYNATFTTVPLVLQSADLQGDVKNIGEISLRINGDGDIWSGVYPQTNIDRMYECRTKAIDFSNQNPDSKIVKLSIGSVWDLQGQITVQSRNPFSLEITAIIGDVSLEETNKRKQ